MDDHSSNGSAAGEGPQAIEASADRAERLRREADAIAKAHADIDAGLGIADDDLEAWLDALDADPNAPIPPPRIGAPRR